MILNQHHTKIITAYSVKKIGDEIVITGKGENKHWKNAIELSDFFYPWETDTPPFTSFKALHNKEWLYCLFKVDDKNINVYLDVNDKTEVAKSDRVEIFFRQDKSLMPYYCLELDPLSRIFDYKAEYYRKLNTKWSWPKGHLAVKAHREKEQYTVEIAISKASLEELGLLKNKTLEAGLYRADCIELKGNEAKFKWISWIKPDSETPDFHIPSSFGLLKLED